MGGIALAWLVDTKQGARVRQQACSDVNLYAGRKGGCREVDFSGLG